MSNQKPAPKPEPFNEDPELVKANFARVVKAYQDAPPDRQSKEKAVGEVLQKIKAEQTKP